MTIRGWAALAAWVTFWFVLLMFAAQTELRL